MKRISAYVPLVLLGLVAALMVSCSSSGDKVVAEIGSKDITVQEFTDFFESRNLSFASADDEFTKKREVLDSMVNARLLAIVAVERGIDRSDEVNRALLANKDKFLLDVMFYKQVIEKAKVTEAEIKDFYDKLAYQVRTSHILVKDEDTAKMLLERIKSGESFEQLAYDYSIDPSAKRNKGDLGYFSWGAMVDEYQDAAFKMKVGEISPPVKSPYGYHIIKLVDKLPNESRTDYASMHKTILNQLKARKQRTLIDNFMKEVRDKYQITVDTVTCQYLFHKREQMYPPQVLEGLPRNNFDLEQLDRNERELVLATWDGGQMSLGGYLEMLKQVPPNYRPDLDNYDSLKTIIFLMKQEDMLATEALKQGLDNDPRYLRKVELFKELTMADILKNDSIKPPPPPSDSVMRAYYDANIEAFSTPGKIHLYEILLKDELQAKKLKESLSSLAAFKDKAMELTIRPDKREVSGDLGYVERTQYPEIYAEAEKTPVGKIGGPVTTGLFFSVFYVADRIASAPKDFLSVKPSIAAKFQQDARNQMVHDLVEEERAKQNVEVKDDVLWSTIDKSSYAAAGGGNN